MRHNFFSKNKSFSSVYLEGSLPANINYYAEYAQQMNGQDYLAVGDNNQSFGFYASLSTFISLVGLSAEYKKYQNFFIGSGINEPPSLVKEHGYRLLNRATHVTNIFNEEGYQLEAYVNVFTDDQITLNHSRAVNQLGKKFKFYEYFAEYYLTANDLNFKFFADYSVDELELDDLRLTGGFDANYVISYPYSINLAIEHQAIDRDKLNQHGLNNVFYQVGLASSTKYSVAFLYEQTSDPSFLGQGQKKRNYYAGSFSYRPGPAHSVSVFAGERRGGPACTSGICYEVLDFKGVEVRYKLNFN
ncbi:MAG: hypothetical protein HC896_08940 [Bacteroidales bacterium]|nr:hypothetical protein [Bacteroidales bacterium]